MQRMTWQRRCILLTLVVVCLKPVVSWRMWNDAKNVLDGRSSCDKKNALLMNIGRADVVKRSICTFFGVAFAFNPFNSVICHQDIAVAAEEATINRLEDIKKSDSEFVQKVQDTRPLNSDEFEIRFTADSLGIKLIENLYKGFPVVTVKEIIDPALLQNHPEFESGAILTKVNGQSVDGIPLKDIIPKVKDAGRPVTLQFRDPSR